MECELRHEGDVRRSISFTTRKKAADSSASTRSRLPSPFSASSSFSLRWRPLSCCRSSSAMSVCNPRFTKRCASAAGRFSLSASPSHSRRSIASAPTGGTPNGAGLPGQRNGCAALAHRLRTVLLVRCKFRPFYKTYGTLGAAIGFMMWMWISAMVILAGAELDAELECQDSSMRKRPTGGLGREPPS